MDCPDPKQQCTSMETGTMFQKWMPCYAMYMLYWYLAVVDNITCRYSNSTVHRYTFLYTCILPSYHIGVSAYVFDIFIFLRLVLVPPDLSVRHQRPHRAVGGKASEGRAVQMAPTAQRGHSGSDSWNFVSVEGWNECTTLSQLSCWPSKAECRMGIFVIFVIMQELHVFI